MAASGGRVAWSGANSHLLGGEDKNVEAVGSGNFDKTIDRSNDNFYQPA
jgi:hypothetical protein